MAGNFHLLVSLEFRLAAFQVVERKDIWAAVRDLNHMVLSLGQPTEVMSSGFLRGPLGPASRQNPSSASNTVNRSAPQALGQDGKSNMQSRYPQPRHPPPPLPPRTDDMFHDEAQYGARYISNLDATQGARYISNNTPEESYGARYISNNSPQTTQSYKAFERQSVVPALEKSQTLDHRPAMGELTDKNAELLEQLRLMRIECDRKTTAVDDMVTEILETENILAEKEAEIARLSTELEQRTPQFSKMEEMFTKRQEAALEEKERMIVTLQAEVNRLSAPMPSLNADAMMLEQQLAQKDDLLTKMTTQLRAWESGWQSHMQKEKEKLEAAIESKYSGSSSELREQTVRREQAEARLRELETRQSTIDRTTDEKVAAALAQAELQKSQSDAYLQQLRVLKDSNAALSQQVAESSGAQIDMGALDKLKLELTEARRLADFFKRNSEQTSKNSKEVASTNRALEEAVAAKTREVDEQNSLIQALKMQLGDIGGQQYSQY